MAFPRLLQIKKEEIDRFTLAELLFYVKTTKKPPLGQVGASLMLITISDSHMAIRVRRI